MSKPTIDRLLLKLVSLESLGGLKTFIRHVSGLAVFFVLARVFTVVAGVVGANVLSKDEYGAANLVVTVGFLLAAVATLGLGPAVVRYGALSKTPGRYISTGLWVSVLSAFILIVLALLFNEQCADLLKVRPDICIMGIVSGGLFTVFAIIAAGQQALSKFTLRGVMELSLAVGYFVMLGSFLYFGCRSWEGIAFAWLLAYIVSMVIGIWPIRKECVAGYDRETFRQMLPYALPNLGCAIGFFFSSNIQRLELNALMTESDVAIYTVYYAASVNMATFVWGMVSTVFFHKAATTNNRENLWNMTVRACILGAVPMFFVLFAATAVYIYFCGHKYVFDVPLAVLFALAASITAIASAVGQVLGTHGVQSVRLALVMSLTIGFLTTAGTWVMIRYCGLGLYATPLAIIIAYTGNIFWWHAVRKKFF